MKLTFTQNQLALTAMPSGEIVHITPAMAKLVDYNVEQHKTWAELLLTSSNYNNEAMAQVANRLKQHVAVIDLIISFTNSINPMLLSIINISSDSTPLLYLIVRKTSLVSATSLFSPLPTLDSQPQDKSSEIKHRFALLNPLEQAVIYLLCNGLKQREVADFLGFSRGYIASIIAYRLCPAVLGVASSSSLQLIKQIRQANLFANEVPQLVTQKMPLVIL